MRTRIRPRLVPAHARAVPGIPGPHTVAVPTCDDSEAEVLTKVETGVYPDWTEAETRVVRLPAVFFTDGVAAMTYFARVHGHVFQNLSTARFWAARGPRR